MIAGLKSGVESSPKSAGKSYIVGFGVFWDELPSGAYMNKRQGLGNVVVVGEDLTRNKTNSKKKLNSKNLNSKGLNSKQFELS